MKECRLCHKGLEEDMVFCPYCGVRLVIEEEFKWYYKNTFLFVGFLFMGPLILPLIWTHPRYSPQVKIVITAILIIITVFVAWSLRGAFKTLVEYYKLIADPFSGF